MNIYSTIFYFLSFFCFIKVINFSENSQQNKANLENQDSQNIKENHIIQDIKKLKLKETHEDYSVYSKFYAVKFEKQEYNTTSENLVIFVYSTSYMKNRDPDIYVSTVILFPITYSIFITF